MFGFGMVGYKAPKREVLPIIYTGGELENGRLARLRVAPENCFMNSSIGRPLPAE